MYSLTLTCLTLFLLVALPHLNAAKAGGGSKPGGSVPSEGQMLGKAAADAKAVIASSKTGRLVRQCSCAEQDPCMERIEQDLQGCFQTCWNQRKTNEMAGDPQKLKQCFESRGKLLKQFISCVNTTAKTCFPTKSGPQIEDVSLQRIIASGEQRMMAQAKSFEKTMGPKNKQIVQTAVDLGVCMKECFVHKDAGKSCFDKAGCQLKLEEELVGPVLKRCAWRMGWKEEAASLCDCFLQAGVTSVKPYCQLLSGSVNPKKKTTQGKQQPASH